MDAAETATSAGRFLDEHPSAVLVVLAGVWLFVDLLFKMAGLVLAPAGIRVLGGQIAVSRVVTFIVDGLILGLVVGLAGIGLSMTYSILNFANFSHGDLVTGGAFVGWVTSWVIAGLGTGVGAGDLLMLGARGNVGAGQLGVTATSSPLAILAGLVVAAVGTVLLALAIDRIVYRPMRDAGGISLLIASIGVALALRYLVVFVWQSGTRGITTAGSVASLRLSVVDGTVTIDAHEATLAVAALGLMVGIHLLLQRTKLGTAMRAMADNKSLARVTGIPTERVVRDTWIIGGALAGSAGYLVALERGTLAFNLGWLLLLLIFAAVILGGIGSIYGAMVGGLLIGITNSLSLVWIPSEFTKAAAFGVMILVLLFRPDGLFGGVSTA